MFSSLNEFFERYQIENYFFLFFVSKDLYNDLWKYLFMSKISVYVSGIFLRISFVQKWISYFKKTLLSQWKKSSVFADFYSNIFLKVIPTFTQFLFCLQLWLEISFHMILKLPYLLNKSNSKRESCCSLIFKLGIFSFENWKKRHFFIDKRNLDYKRSHSLFVSKISINSINTPMY